MLSIVVSPIPVQKYKGADKIELPVTVAPLECTAAVVLLKPLVKPVKVLSVIPV